MPMRKIRQLVEAKAGAGGRTACSSDEGRRRRFSFRMSENSLNLCLVGAAAGGMALGWHIRHHGVSGRLLKLMDFPGELYMRMLECLAMPVVTSSIVAGLGSVDILLAGNIGLIAMLYFVVATVMASTIGIGVALFLGPQREGCWRRQRLTHVDGFLDLLRNLFPDNYLAACLQTTVTVPQNVTGASADEAPFTTVSESRANVLGLLSVSVMLGAVLSVTVSESDALLNLFVGLSNATVTVSHLTAWFSPVGVFFLVATRLTQVKDMDRAYGAVRSFFHVILAGLAAYGLGLLPVLYVLATRQDPRHFLRVTLAPAMKAFRSASRTVSVPGTIEALEELASLEPRIVRFVIPVGANVSMSGTALVAAATAVVLARLDGLEVGLEELLIIGATVVLASLGAASIPNSSVLTVLMILMALQVSSRDISLVFALDWAVDRFRTTVNIYSDSVGSAIVQQFGRLEPMESSQDNSRDERAAIETATMQLRRSTVTGSDPDTPPEPGTEGTRTADNCEEPQPPNTWQQSSRVTQSSFASRTTDRLPSAGQTEQWTSSSRCATTSLKVPPASMAPGAPGTSSQNEAAPRTEVVALDRRSPEASTCGSPASRHVCEQPPPSAATHCGRHEPLDMASSDVGAAKSTSPARCPCLLDAPEAIAVSRRRGLKSPRRQALLAPVNVVGNLETMQFGLRPKPKSSAQPRFTATSQAEVVGQLAF
ncbi:excitatory amino acid transporter 3-like [Amblyomma americanum]